MTSAPRLGASSLQRWGSPAKQLGKSPQVLSGCGQQYFILATAQTPQSEPVEPEDALHMRKPHLNLLSLAARLLEGFRLGEGPDTIAHILIDVSRDLAHRRCSAPRFQQAG